MKSAMSSLDIRAAVEECQPLVQGKVAKAIAGKSTIAIAIHRADVGKKWLVARIPGFFYACEDKPDVGSQSPFQSAIKSMLEGIRLEAVEQLGLERAVKLTFSRREGKLEIIIELFSTGNAMLIENGIVLLPLKKPDPRNLRQMKGKEYHLPAARPSVWDMEEKEIETILASDLPISEQIAKNGLGAVWAKEVCLKAGIDPSKKAQKGDAKKIVQSVKSLLKTPCDPRIVKKDMAVVDIVPFQLQSYEDTEQIPSAMGAGIANLLAQADLFRSSFDSRIEKVERILESQKTHESELVKEIEEDSRRGELIFEKYQLVKEILDELQKARAKLGWKEIKDKLKNHRIIKDIKESTGDIEVEL